MLLRGGTALVTALGMVDGLMPAALRPRLAQATQRIREGASISAAMEAAGLVTPVALRLLRVGERSGEMAEMMDRIAVFHDEELARWIDLVTKLFEPLLMAAIGVVIGAIVVLMYLPIFELAGSLQ
jgi:general secretion pathway protein F